MAACDPVGWDGAAIPFLAGPGRSRTPRFPEPSGKSNIEDANLAAYDGRNNHDFPGVRLLTAVGIVLSKQVEAHPFGTPLMSYLLGAVIVALAIDIVASLSS